MKTLIILFTFLLSFSFIYSQSKENIAKKKGVEAVKLMEEGQIEESITLLEEAQKLDSHSFIYPYEIAYAHCLKEDYDEAINILKKIESYDDVSDMFYQMLGNCYDYTGDSEEAIKTYKKGLEKFPDSGCLHLELGNMKFAKGDEQEALSYFEKGIEAEPTYPSNYYWAAKIYLNSEDEVWGMLYGELFMNMERNSNRTVEMSKLLFDTYKNEIQIVNDSTISVSFCKYLNVTEDLDSYYGIGVYEPILLLSLPQIEAIDIKALNKVRTNFLDIYHKREIGHVYPHVLIDYQEQIREAGHLEAYNYWILMQGDTQEFLDWRSTNEDKWTDFTKWFVANPIKISPHDKFVKHHY